MASPTCLHSTAVTQTLLPFLRRRTPLLHSQFRRLLTGSASFTKSSNRYKLLAQPVFAQARRSFSPVAKEEVVASPSDLQFEGPLKIVEYPDPILRAKNKRVKTFDERLKKLVDEMFDVMYRRITIRTTEIRVDKSKIESNLALEVFD